MMKRTTQRATALAAAGVLVVASTFASAQQFTLQKANSIALGTQFTATTGYGANPLSVAFDGTSAYVGGYNSTGAAASIGVVRVDNLLSGAAAFAPLAATQFTSPFSRGIDQMDFGGGALFVNHDAGTAPNSVSFVRRVNASTGATEWQIDNPQGARPMALAVDPIGNAGAPAVSFLVQGSGFVRRLSAADGSTILSSTTPNTFGIFNTPPGSSYRSLDFDSAGNLIYGEDSGIGVGIRDLTTTGNNYNRVVKVDDPTSAGTSPVIIKSPVTAATNNVGNGATFLERATSDGSGLIVFSPRISGAGNTAGITATLTPLVGTATTVEAKRAQIRFVNGSTANGSFSLAQTELLGNEDGIGSAYAGELKNFASALDASGNPVLLVVDYFTKQLDVYTIEPRYSLDADSNWTNPAAWTLGIVPNSATTNATFAGGTTGPRGVLVDGPKTVKQLKFDSAHRYSLAGTGTINLTAPANDNHPAYITVLNGSHTVSAPVVLGSNARFDVNNAADTLTLGTVQGAGRGLTKRGAGTVTATHVRVSALAVNEGTLRLNPNGTEAGISRVATLTLGTSPTGGTPTVGTIDLTNNGLIVDYPADAATSPFATLRDAIRNGTITSSLLTSNTAIGIIERGSATTPSFTDPALLVDATTVILRHTLKGDTDLNRAVNFDDLLSLAQNYDATATDKTWGQGDSNDDGVVNFDDLLSLAQNYGQSLSVAGAALAAAGVGGETFSADFALAQSLVPEPTLGLLGVAGVAMLTRGRRRGA